MFDIVSSKHFKQDLKLAKRRGLNIGALREVISILASGKTLDPRFHTHSLDGNYRGFHECHVNPDWLLIYRIDADTKELFLFRTGTHADLFE